MSDLPGLVEENPVSLMSLADGFRTGEQSPIDYLASLENRFIEREPYVQAFVPQPESPFKRLRRQLEELIALYPDPSVRPLLFGIPVGVKDIIHVDGFPTRAGSRLPSELITSPEAAVVKQLKVAGALILGKTVTVQFAHSGPGPTRNPHQPGHTPGGSSSGSAAAVAAGLCPLALGTQTVGSVIRPAAYCGVVGFKPSYGRIPVDGIIPLAPSLDHVGFFTTDVEGAHLVASILIDDWTAVAPQDPSILGVPTGPYLTVADDAALSHFHKTCRQLANDIQITSIKMFNHFEKIVNNNDHLEVGEFALVHRKWFRKYADLYSTGTSESIRRGQQVTPKLLENCRTFGLRLRDQIMDSMRRHQISAIIAPAATGPAPRGLEDPGDWTMNLPWTYAGLPVITLPCGASSEGLPLGLQIIGAWREDENLFNIAQRLAGRLADLVTN